MQKPAVVFADFPRVLVEAPEIALDILDIVFDIAPEDVGVVTGRLRIAWQDGTGWSETGVRETWPRDAREKGQSL